MLVAWKIARNSDGNGRSRPPVFLADKNAKQELLTADIRRLRLHLFDEHGLSLVNSQETDQGAPPDDCRDWVHRVIGEQLLADCEGIVEMVIVERGRSMRDFGSDASGRDDVELLGIVLGRVQITCPHCGFGKILQYLRVTSIKLVGPGEGIVRVAVASQ